VAEKTAWENLTGAKKAAIVMLALGKDAAAKVLKGLPSSEVERIASEIATMGMVPKEVQERVLKEFTGAMSTHSKGSEGGVDRVAELLESALGRSKASEIVTKVRRQSGTGVMGKLEQMEAGTVAEFLKSEHPQTIALIVAQLTPDFAARTLRSLPEELRGDVAMRIATMEPVAPDTAREMETILSSQLEGIGSIEATTADGVKILADILNVTGRETEKEILEAINEKDPAVANDVRQLMFIFDDILLLNDKAMQRVLREVDTKDLAVALKAADDEVKDKIFKNISERAAAMIQEEIDYMGPKRLSEVRIAQQAIVEVIRNLEESGEIIIPGRGGASDDVIV
jgi:flagellar motor switch protein FliG